MDICAKLERVLEQGGEHGVVDGHERRGGGTVHEGGYRWDVDNVHQGVCWGLEEDHCCFCVQLLSHGLDVGSVYVMHDDLAVGG